ncbi:translocase of chloroplast [Forsythia ovata]|uniref:Translocase of chloroplast n=1 Tax=Forsythia ovata TaxID=205694 RepID=A0ABD1VL91_9LAMI
MNEVVDHEDLISDDAIDGMILGSSEAAKQFIEELERGSGADSLLKHYQGIDGQIVTDLEEEVDTDEEGDGKEALLKAATFLMFEKPILLHPHHCYRLDFGPINYYYPLKSVPGVDFVENYPIVISPSMAFAAANV